MSTREVRTSIREAREARARPETIVEIDEENDAPYTTFNGSPSAPWGQMLDGGVGASVCEHPAVEYAQVHSVLNRFEPIMLIRLRLGSATTHGGHPGSVCSAAADAIEESASVRIER